MQLPYVDCIWRLVCARAPTSHRPGWGAKPKFTFPLSLARRGILLHALGQAADEAASIGPGWGVRQVTKHTYNVRGGVAPTRAGLPIRLGARHLFRLTTHEAFAVLSRHAHGRFQEHRYCSSLVIPPFGSRRQHSLWRHKEWREQI